MKIFLSTCFIKLALGAQKNHLNMLGDFTFERIHNMKEQIFSYESGEKHKAKEWMFKSFKCANFPCNDPILYNGGHPRSSQMILLKACFNIAI